MSLVYATYVPNAPFLISPAAFGGVGASTAEALVSLRLKERFEPGAVVVSTPHWISNSVFLVNESSRPRQVYDFSGMPRALLDVAYEPPGDPELAQAMVQAASTAGVAVRGTQEWGLDHGAWAPLLHLLPGAKVPVVPMSITSHSPESHVAFGRAVRSLLDAWPKPVVFVATGSITHNFERFSPDPNARWPEGERIEGEILDLLQARDDEALLHFDREKWNTVKPEGRLRPLFTLLGVVGPEVRPRIVHRTSAMGGFGMTILEFLPR
ncbi:MAG: class III extradiol ring-cleavage dioxygenase [Thermoplasmata archaeon]